MSSQSKITLFAQKIAAEMKAAETKVGNLTLLSTTAKDNLVAAVNEVKTIAENATVNPSDFIDDASTTALDKSYSVAKIVDLLADLEISIKNDLLGGASAAWDTLKEIETAFGTEATAQANLVTAVGFRVRFDAPQALDTTQKAQARANIGAAADADLTSLSGTVSALSTAVGDTDHDFVADYEAAKAA